jgi:uncharacterized protein YkwD
MFRVVRTAALLAVLACFLALPAVASAKSAQLRMYERVNAFRANHGVKPLRFSNDLAASARRYSHKMMSSGRFGHSSRIHASRRFRTLGEVIEYHPGRHIRLGQALRSWKHSSAHRSLLLNGSFRYAGAGFTTGRYHGRGATMWVMHFGRK